MVEEFTGEESGKSQAFLEVLRYVWKDIHPILEQPESPNQFTGEGGLPTHLTGSLTLSWTRAITIQRKSFSGLPMSPDYLRLLFLDTEGPILFILGYGGSETYPEDHSREMQLAENWYHYSVHLTTQQIYRWPEEILDFLRELYIPKGKI